MSEQADQPRVKRSRFDTTADVSGAAAAPAAKPAIPTSEAAKAAVEKARKVLETQKKLAETLAKLKGKKVRDVMCWAAFPEVLCFQTTSRLPCTYPCK